MRGSIRIQSTCLILWVTLTLCTFTPGDPHNLELPCSKQETETESAAHVLSADMTSRLRPVGKECTSHAQPRGGGRRNCLPGGQAARAWRGHTT